jgi:predicted ABC-type exoprotein transport system permease subunit
MKRLVICFSVLIFCFYFNLSLAQETELTPESIERIVNNTVRPYFVALKNGDIKILKEMMAKGMYEERKVLFEQNKEYPDFLRKLYRDADFIILSAGVRGNDILVNTVIKYPDGRQNQARLYLINNNRFEKKASYEFWKISRKPGSK